MRIALDARPLATPLTGIGRYTAELLKRLSHSGHQWYLYSDRPLQHDILARETVHLRQVPLSNNLLARLAHTQLSYSRWAKKDDIDLFWSPRHHLPLFLPGHIRRVVTIHDLVWRRFPRTMQRKNLWLERLLMGPSIRTADRVICDSDFTAAEVAHYYPAARDKCRTVHLGPGRIENPANLPEGTPRDYMLFTGTLEPRKNLVRLLNACARLAATGKAPALVVVGATGWGDLNLPSLVSSLSLDKHVFLAGQVPDERLHALYAHARCLLMPSLYEGFGLPVVEAMQYGVPAIVSNTGSLPEVAGKAALLVDPYSEQALADAMQRMAGDDALRDRLSAAALDQAPHFSWDKAARETLALFEEVAEAH